MILLDMGLQIILVSVSGVLTPGPLFFANLALSKYGGFWSGIKIAIGHTIVELPVIILYSIPLIVFSTLNMSFSMFKVISFIGGISLIAFGILYVVRNISKIDNRHYAVNSFRIENRRIYLFPFTIQPGILVSNMVLACSFPFLFSMF